MAENKREIKDKWAMRKKLLRYNYKLKDDSFNDKNKGECWSRNVKFVIKNCSFDWKALKLGDNTVYVCDCEVINVKSKKLYNAQIVTKLELKHQIEHQIQNSRCFAIYKGTVFCILFDFKYYLNVFIFPEKIGDLIEDYQDRHFWDLMREKSNVISHSQNIDFVESDGDYDYEYNDFDWERETFNALTDGQYGDYDEFDGDWDGLDDWRGG
jgi:hypothetical protein